VYHLSWYYNLVKAAITYDFNVFLDCRSEIVRGKSVVLLALVHEEQTVQNRHEGGNAGYNHKNNDGPHVLDIRAVAHPNERPYEQHCCQHDHDQSYPDQNLEKKLVSHLIFLLLLLN